MGDWRPGSDAASESPQSQSRRRGSWRGGIAYRGLTTAVLYVLGKLSPSSDQAAVRRRERESDSTGTWQSRNWPPPSDAIEAAALAAALAESALESERKERAHTVGLFEHTPQHLHGPALVAATGAIATTWLFSLP
jgi:hypothetical protein